MSTVASITKRHNGFIEVKSQSGDGTTFRIFLPAVGAKPVEDSRPRLTRLPMGQGGWILVVIDEQMVLELARTTLENYGYRVLTAGNGLAAIACFEARQAEIRVLVTDTDMPFQGGLETIQTIQRMRADIPVSVASGIQSDTHRVTRIDTTHLTTLSKSYGVEHLLEAVARVLSVPQKG